MTLRQYIIKKEYSFTIEKAFIKLNNFNVLYRLTAFRLMDRQASALDSDCPVCVLAAC